jgi:hypothetical protein
MMTPAQQLTRAAATLDALRIAIHAVPPRDENETAADYGRRLREWGWSQSTLAKLAGAVMCAASDEIDLPVQAVEPSRNVTKGRPIIGDRPMTAAERQQRHRASQQEDA